MQRTGLYLVLLLFFVSLFTISCGPKIIPVAVKGAVINEKRGSISIDKEGITVTAEASILYRTPYNLEDYFTPFRVVIRNETGEDINIDYSNFILLDEKGNQYKAYPPEKITEIVKSDPDYVMQPPTVAVPLPDLRNYTSVLNPPPYPYGYYYPYGTPYYDPALRRWEYPPRSYQEYRRELVGETLLQDIYLTSIPVGSIIDGAQISGDLFFRVDLRKINSAKVRVTINKATFVLPFLVK